MKNDSKLFVEKYDKTPHTGFSNQNGKKQLDFGVKIDGNSIELLLVRYICYMKCYYRFTLRACIL